MEKKPPIGIANFFDTDSLDSKVDVVYMSIEETHRNFASPEEKARIYPVTTKGKVKNRGVFGAFVNRHPNEFTEEKLRELIKTHFNEGPRNMEQSEEKTLREEYAAAAAAMFASGDKKKSNVYIDSLSSLYENFASSLSSSPDTPLRTRRKLLSELLHTPQFLFPVEWPIEYIHSEFSKKWVSRGILSNTGLSNEEWLSDYDYLDSGKKLVKPTTGDGNKSSKDDSFNPIQYEQQMIRLERLKKYLIGLRDHYKNIVDEVTLSVRYSGKPTSSYYLAFNAAANFDRLDAIIQGFLMNRSWFCFNNSDLYPTF